MLLGDSVQQVLLQLGPPCAQVRHSCTLFNCNCIHVDFKKGFDIVFEKHIVSKILFHTNVLAHHLVARYTRHDYRIELDDKVVTAADGWSKTNLMLNKPLGPPVISKPDHQPFESTCWYMYENGIGLEILKKTEEIATIIIWRE